MFHYFDTITNTRGDSLAGWQVECVLLSDGSTVVDIFADESGTPISSVSGVANRAVTDENGNYDFYVPSGTYSLRIYNSSGVFQRLQRYLPMYGTDYVERIVSPEDFTGTDTEKLQAALNTGGPVYCTAASYSVTDTLTITANGQVIDLGGALVTPTGNFNVFEFAPDIQGATICNGRFNGDFMTGGYIVYVSNADRLTIRDLVVGGPWNFCYIEQSNVTEIRNVWVNNVRGDYGIRWYGDATKRSDILRLIGVVISAPNSSAVGIDWDGDCHTMQAWGVALPNCGKGLVIRNSSGGPPPALGFFTGLEIDFPDSYGVEILAGSSYYFGPQFYCHGSATTSGVFVDSSLADETVTIMGGKVTSHATYGIESSKRVLALNLDVSNNGTSAYLDGTKILTRTPRMEIDGTYFMRLDGTNPILQFDASDFIGFNRSANDLFASLGGSTRFQVSAGTDAVRLMVGGTLRQVTVGAADSGGTGFKVLRVPN
jgi:hypothetical protein